MLNELFLLKGYLNNILKNSYLVNLKHHFTKVNLRNF